MKNNKLKLTLLKSHRQFLSWALKNYLMPVNMKPADIRNMYAGEDAKQKIELNAGWVAANMPKSYPVYAYIECISCKYEDFEPRYLYLPYALYSKPRSTTANRPRCNA